ncbi:MAG: adenine deaminase [Deltaproteobacteria bacterium]|nr:adenine deaminase [Deltaproteobacteria bacterium]
MKTLNPLSEPDKLASLIRVAGGSLPADTVIRGASVYNVFTGQLEPPGDLAIFDRYIAGFGPMGSYKGREVIEVLGYLVPGFIDSHVHIESSMASPQSLSCLLAECGVTTAAADPHEIVNVVGLKGLDYFLQVSQNLPMDFIYALPSCVPASDLEKGGATVTADELKSYYQRPRVFGLGEVMNYPGVIGANHEVMAKIASARAHDSIIDGHAPHVSGLAMNAYRAAGITSCHEASTAAEAKERLAKGLWLMIREGTAARNLNGLWPAVTKHNSRFCLLATDDRHAQDLVSQGSINHLVRLAQSLSPELLPEILNMATWNAADYFGLRDRGAISPGFLADLALYPDLISWKPQFVYKSGIRVFPLENETGFTATDYGGILTGTVQLGPLDISSLKVPAHGSKVRVIGLRPGQIITDSLLMSWPAKDGFYESSAEYELVKMAVFNRYGGDGKAKVGFLKGLGLKAGAMAQTVSHDSHQLVAAGVSDEDIILAAQTVADLGGGLAMVRGGRVLGSLPLPLGGIMSHEPVRKIARDLTALAGCGRELGITDGDPFLTLGFMSLPVIPELKLTTAGLIENFKVVPLVHP